MLVNDSLLQISQMISHSNLIVLLAVFSFPFIQGVLLVKVSCFLMSKASLISERIRY